MKQRLIVTYRFASPPQFDAFLLWIQVHQIDTTNRVKCVARSYRWVSRGRKAESDSELVHTPSIRCSSWLQINIYLTQTDSNDNWLLTVCFFIFFSLFSSFFFSIFLLSAAAAICYFGIDAMSKSIVHLKQV